MYMIITIHLTYNTPADYPQVKKRRRREEINILKDVAKKKKYAEEN